MDGQGPRTGVVVADDDPALRLVCRVNLELEGYRVFEAEDAAALARILGDEDVAAVLLDIHFGTDDGIEVARGLRDSRPDVGVALFSGSAGRPVEAEPLVDGFLSKPFTLEDLSETVRLLVRR